MKELPVNIPDSPFFLVAFPAPVNDRFEVANTPVQMTMLRDGKRVLVERGDYFHFPLKMLSNIICRLAYGKDKEWVKNHLKEQYRYLTDESEVAFFLFRELKEAE